MTIKKRAVVWLLIPIGVCWLVTGGIVDRISHQILPQSSEKKASYTPLIFCEMYGKERSKGIPFLFISIQSNMPPYSLQFKYTTHNVVRNATLVITEFSVEYHDGNSSDLKSFIGKEIAMKHTEHFYVDDEGTQQGKASLQADIVLPDCVPVWKPLTLKVVSEVRAGGKVVEKSTFVTRFTRTTNKSTMTTWSWFVKSQG